MTDGNAPRVQEETPRAWLVTGSEPRRGAGVVLGDGSAKQTVSVGARRPLPAKRGSAGRVTARGEAPSRVHKFSQRRVSKSL